MRLAKEAPKFRGAWSPSLANPTPQGFVPVVRNRYEKPKPKPKAAPAPVAAAPPPKQEAPREQIEMPKDSLMNILDRNNDFRSFITKDGTCKDKTGKIIGYINIGEWNVGSPDMEFWGQMDEGELIEDKDGKKIGELDLGHGTIKNEVGNTVCELDNAGECKGNAQTYIGKFIGFTFKNMKIVALYLLIVDPGMYDEIDG